ncbi:MAG: histidine phosphotransferase family protein [Acetobacteraceae bacterium]
MSDGTTDELTLAQDLAARICHDLGGPVGMVAGLLDLLDEPDAEALASAREGAAELRKRLLLWRAATGGSGPVPLSDVPGLADGLLAGGRVTLSLSCAAGLPAEAGQILLLAAMVAAEALPKGGAVEIASGSGDVLVLADGPIVRWPPALLALLGGEEAEPGARTVLPRLLLQLVAAHGWRAELLMAGEAAPPLLLLRPPAG